MPLLEGSSGQSGLSAHKLLALVENAHEGQSQSIVRSGKGICLDAADLGSVPGTVYGPPVTIRCDPQCRAKSTMGLDI